MFNIFVAEFPAVLADSKAYSMTTGTVIRAEVFRVEGLDGVATFYADGHCTQILNMLSSVMGWTDHIVRAGAICVAFAKRFGYL
jgi:hypothetical protein